MADRSRIEWTDASWSPVRARNLATGKLGWHCEHASPGCANCYGEGFNARLGTQLPFKPGHRADTEIILDPAMLLQPLRWARPRMVFVCSMTDLFADFVPDAFIDQVFAVMALCPQHTFQVLTKRSARMRAYLSNSVLQERIVGAASDIASGAPKLVRGGGHIALRRVNGIDKNVGPWPLPNVWIGVSAEDQRRADERVLDLLATPAAMRFVSAEPLLGNIDFRHLAVAWNVSLDALTGQFTATASFSGHLANFQAGLDALPPLPARRPALDWIIVGGESGPSARLMHPDWARIVRDQCASAGVSFFFKQWGAWKPICAMADGEADALYRSKRIAKEGESQDTVDEFHGRRCIVPVESIGFGGALGLDAFFMVDGHGGMTMFNIGKKAAGRLLDGVEHNGMPDRATAATSA